MEEIYLLGSDTNHANLVVSDVAGRRLGYVNGKLVREIPGARVVELFSNQDWTNNMAPEFFVPANGEYTITVDGTGLASPDTEKVGIVGPSSELSIRDIPMKPGDKNIMVVGPDATELSYKSTSAETPNFELGVSDDGADYSFVIRGVSDLPGNTITLGLPAEGGRLNMRNVGSGPPSTVSLTMTRYTQKGTQVFTHDAISLVEGDSAKLEFGHWSDTAESIPIVTTHNGQQSVQTLTNQGTQ